MAGSGSKLITPPAASPDPDADAMRILSDARAPIRIVSTPYVIAIETEIRDLIPTRGMHDLSSEVAVEVVVLGMGLIDTAPGLITRFHPLCCVRDSSICVGESGVFQEEVTIDVIGNVIEKFSP